MYRTTHLIHSFMNRRGLLGMGLGVYWAFVLVVTFRAHPEKYLGDLEMMKIVGGDSSGGSCAVRNGSTCNVSDPCVVCDANQINLPCTTREQVALFPEECYGSSSNDCIPSGTGIRAACHNYNECICTRTGKSQICISNGKLKATDCFTIYPGVILQCTYQNCPPGS